MPVRLFLMQVAVKAVGLNFRDVLNVLGMYPGDPGAPGYDFAGVIMQAGQGVDSLQQGNTGVASAGNEDAMLITEQGRS